MTPEPRLPSFSTNGLIDYIIELIVEEDEVSNIINHCHIILIIYIRLFNWFIKDPFADYSCSFGPPFLKGISLIVLKFKKEYSEGLEWQRRACARLYQT